MSRRPLLVAAATAAAALAWYVMVLRPVGSRTEQARSRAEEAALAEADLAATVARLRRLAADLPAAEADAARLEALVPSALDVEGQVDALHDLAARTGVRWLSLAPGPPEVVPGTGLTSVVLTMEVQGTYFQILDYLLGMESLRRFAVVDSIEVDADAVPAGPGAGAPTLTAGLATRIFSVTAAAAGAEGGGG